MIALFKKLKNISVEESIKIGITSVGQDIYFLGKWNIDSDEKYFILEKLIMNDYLMPISHKYFLDFIASLPIPFSSKIKC